MEAVVNTQLGILSGFQPFRSLAFVNIFAGLALLVLGGFNSEVHNNLSSQESHVFSRQFGRRFVTHYFFMLELRAYAHSPFVPCNMQLRQVGRL